MINYDVMIESISQLRENVNKLEREVREEIERDIEQSYFDKINNELQQSNLQVKSAEIEMAGRTMAFPVLEEDGREVVRKNIDKDLTRINRKLKEVWSEMNERYKLEIHGLTLLSKEWHTT